MSDCSFCIGGGDVDGYAEMFQAGVIKSRKDHKCEECRRPILKGQSCERASGKFDGDFFTAHTCMDCFNIRNAFQCGEPLVAGELWEDISNNFANLTTACLAKVETQSAREYLIARWQKWKGIAV